MTGVGPGTAPATAPDAAHARAALLHTLDALEAATAQLCALVATGTPPQHALAFPIGVHAAAIGFHAGRLSPGPRR
ncbi:hypothetical protein HS048_35500 [Planomonospora sp. ID91781]|uniref:hypothetical protein n=1 Tax=Planomonospora sp. ID91781 TaxID=2738135 RepID=UPI0018C416EF|nr:hypothetical protein [Planomonospora sp. ID91781]MBG0825979.1 hypothetical protein [Planomonospora sp. ID91781]